MAAIPTAIRAIRTAIRALAIREIPDRISLRSAPAIAAAIAVLTIVALYYYLVLASRMYIDAPVKSTAVPLTMPLLLAILFCAVGTVVMGLYPELWVKSALHATAALFS